MSRLLFAVPFATLLVLTLPFYVAAATNSEIIAILKEGIAGVVSLVRVAYCASGVAVLCP